MSTLCTHKARDVSCIQAGKSRSVRFRLVHGQTALLFLVAFSSVWKLVYRRHNDDVRRVATCSD